MSRAALGSGHGARAKCTAHANPRRMPSPLAGAAKRGTHGLRPEARSHRGGGYYFPQQ